ncbi:MAG: hypothetical protein ACTSPE_06140 [Candidatus Thorarchaeota archaeon]
MPTGSTRGDSDYSGAYINDNMTAILEAVGSHVYPEPTSIEDPVSNCGAGYRPVANKTSDDAYVADIVEGTTKVLMHGPTLLYGSNSDTPGENVSANVYPLLYYGGNATIVDHDILYPYAHKDGDKGEFVAATLEVKAGEAGDGVIVVSGASPYGDYQPMCSWEYHDVELDGYNLVINAIHYGIGIAREDAPTIVFDFSHGQYSTKLINTTDLQLAENLTAMGYNIVWAMGGINDSILSDAVGLVLASVYGEANGFLQSEIQAIADWFNDGGKLLWVGCDSDYSGAYINDNMTAILEAVGSHVYPEPTSIEDPVSNCGAGYRPVANKTSDDSYVADIVEGTTKVLMHGPTLLYGSDSDTPGENVSAVALETTTIDNVYPLLYYGGNATIVDHDILYPYAHKDGDKGEFVAATLEVEAGEAGTGVIIVSGASPYGDYQPMCSWEYHDVELDGYNLVINGITKGISIAYDLAHPTTTTTTSGTTTSATTTTTGTTSTTPVTTGVISMNTMFIIGGVAVVVIVIIVVLMKKR